MHDIVELAVNVAVAVATVAPALAVLVEILSRASAPAARTGQAAARANLCIVFEPLVFEPLVFEPLVFEPLVFEPLEAEFEFENCLADR